MLESTKDAGVHSSRIKAYCCYTGTCFWRLKWLARDGEGIGGRVAKRPLFNTHNQIWSVVEEEGMGKRVAREAINGLATMKLYSYSCISYNPLFYSVARFKIEVVHGKETGKRRLRRKIIIQYTVFCRWGKYFWKVLFFSIKRNGEVLFPLKRKSSASFFERREAPLPFSEAEKGRFLSL